MKQRYIVISALVSVLIGSSSAPSEVLQTLAGSLTYDVRGEGCPLVLVGGGSAMDSRQWDGTRDALADRFMTIAVDPLGIGGSDNPSAPYADADDLISLLDHLEIQAALFAGGSSAGGTVLEVVLAYPERVIGGVAIAPFLIGFEPSPEMAQRFQRFGKAGMQGGEAFVELVKSDPHFLLAPEHPEVRDKAWPMIIESFARPDGDPTLARLPEPPLLDRLDQITVPILLAAGELDHPDIGRRLDYLEERLLGAQRTMIASAGHTAAMENPDAFVEAVLPFLHGLGCRSRGPAWARARAEVLALHQDALRFHLEEKTHSWLDREIDVQMVANRGSLVFPMANERKAKRQSYFQRTDFSVYRDLRPPIVRLSDDLSMGWLMAEVEIEGTQQTEEGKVPFRSVWAWIELFEQNEGKWSWVGNVSNAKP